MPLSPYESTSLVLDDVMSTQQAVALECHSPFPTLWNENIVAKGHGVTVGIALTEPTLFIQGYHQHDQRVQKSAVLRGQIHLKVTKHVKIKKISILFRGRAQTDWPDSLPLKKSFHDRNCLLDQSIVYFGHGDTTLMLNDHGAHYYHPMPAPPVPGKYWTSAATRKTFFKSKSNIPLDPDTAQDAKYLYGQTTCRRVQTFKNNEASICAPVKFKCNYGIFPMGDYLYSFEFPIGGSLPETIKTGLGFVRYGLEAVVERPGSFCSNLKGAMEIPIIRTPDVGALEQVNPILISRNWRDLLHYDIVISGKSFPLGSQIPIAVRLTPLARVKCNRIKVYLTENIQYRTIDKSMHRLQPTRRVLLFEKSSQPASSNTGQSTAERVTAGGIYWDLCAGAASGKDVDRTSPDLLSHLSHRYSDMRPTEMEVNVRLPGCHEMKDWGKMQALHCDTTYENIQVNHWIKIVLRLSRVDEQNWSKRPDFEISIDSPLQILSCRATEANIYPPAYSYAAVDSDLLMLDSQCGCPRGRTSGVTQVPDLSIYL